MNAFYLSCYQLTNPLKPRRRSIANGAIPLQRSLVGKAADGADVVIDFG